jgi:hypothetical protein
MDTTTAVLAVPPGGMGRVLFVPLTIVVSADWGNKRPKPTPG